MTHAKNKIKIYHNQELIDDLNFMFIWIKKYIFCKNKYPNTPRPTISELDYIMSQIINELKKDNENMVKH